MSDQTPAKLVEHKDNDGWIEGSNEPDTVPASGLAPTNQDGTVQTVVAEHIDRTRERADALNKDAGMVPENPGARAYNVNQASAPPTDIHADAKRHERDKEENEDTQDKTREPIETDTVIYRGHDEENKVVDMRARVLKVYSTSTGETPKIDVHIYSGRIHGERTIVDDKGDTVIIPNTERREVPFLANPAPNESGAAPSGPGWFWPNT